MSAKTGQAPLALIASVAHGGVIGNANQLVWRDSADQRWFRQQTMACPVIMGRKTWDSLPARFRPLPGRVNIVVTRQRGWQDAGATQADSLAEALAAARQAAARDGSPRVFVIGGGQLFAEALPLADELLLTEIDAELAGEIRFPAFDRSAFIETRREAQRTAGPAPVDFAFVSYQRVR